MSPCLRPIRACRPGGRNSAVRGSSPLAVPLNANPSAAFNGEFLPALQLAVDLRIQKIRTVCEMSLGTAIAFREPECLSERVKRFHVFPLCSSCSSAVCARLVSGRRTAGRNFARKFQCSTKADEATHSSPHYAGDVFHCVTIRHLSAQLTDSSFYLPTPLPGNAVNVKLEICRAGECGPCTAPFGFKQLHGGGHHPGRRTGRRLL
jgi:hypothetical protein